MAEKQSSCSFELSDFESVPGGNLENCNEENETDDINESSCDYPDGILRCDRCDFETTCSSSWSSHLSSCVIDDEKRRIFECDVCQMKFSNGANMRRHKMRHTGVKPYECKVCQKRFFRKDHLAEHYTTHTKTLPFHCPVCNRGFQRQIAMRAHFQNEHVGQNDVVKSCPMCSFWASSMKSLRLHFYNRHGIDLDKPHSCDSRETDNITPPMHFLTPQVEISMSEPALSPGNNNNSSEGGNQISPGTEESEVSGGSEDSMSQHVSQLEVIPVKKEPSTETSDQPASSLIKVSPLKSLLSEEPQRGLVGPWEHHTNLIQGINRDRRRNITIATASDSQWNHSSSESASDVGISPTQHPSRLECQYCMIVFPDRTLYFLHKGCHSTTETNNPWKCNICGEQTNNVYDFNSHLLSKTHH